MFYEWVKVGKNDTYPIVGEAIPLRGVCEGHQFIARALEAKVIYNPRGREFGTLPVTLTAEGVGDPLFLEIPDRFFVQLTHFVVPNLQQTKRTRRRA